MTTTVPARFHFGYPCLTKWRQNLTFLFGQHDLHVPATASHFIKAQEAADLSDWGNA